MIYQQSTYSMRDPSSGSHSAQTESNAASAEPDTLHQSSAGHPVGDRREVLNRVLADAVLPRLVEKLRSRV
jgi:hypothetical protein